MGWLRLKSRSGGALLSKCHNYEHSCLISFASFPIQHLSVQTLLSQVQTIYIAIRLAFSFSFYSIRLSGCPKKRKWTQNQSVKLELPLTDVVSVMQCVAVRQARYSQVSLSPQTIQHILDKVLSLCQGQEDLHVVCHTHRHPQRARSQFGK